MRWAPLLAVACGCNTIFGVEQTRLVDAPPPIDARPDAACAGPGSVPSFRTELNFVDAPYAQSYEISVDADISAGFVVEQNYIRTIGVGSPNAELVPQKIELPVGYIHSVHLTPEGDALYVLFQHQLAPYTSEVLVLTRPEGTWKVESTFDPAMAAIGTTSYLTTITQPTRGPERRLLFPAYDASNNNTITVYELANSGGGWMAVGKHPLIDFTKQSFDQPSLTPDGLALVFASYSYPVATDAGTFTPYVRKIFYTSRADLDSPFAEPQELMTVPGEVTWPFLTEDCSRIYFSALNTVFYLPY